MLHPHVGGTASNCDSGIALSCAIARRLTDSGVQLDRYEAGIFGSCPCVYCVGCTVVPCGRSDIPGLDTVQLFCPNCNDIYSPPSSHFQGVDGK